jgi:hypothetical protein
VPWSTEFALLSTNWTVATPIGFAMSNGSDERVGHKE